MSQVPFAMDLSMTLFGTVFLFLSLGANYKI